MKIPDGWTEEEGRWVQGKWRKIRDSQRRADVASNLWNRINEELNEYLDRKGETDIVQRSKIKDASLPLKDAYNAGNWHSRNAERHIHDLNLFLKLKEMGLL